MLLGEFGSKLATASDQQWFDKMTAYLGGDLDGNGTNDLAAGQQGISWTYWSWNPNSGDTGGILADDWNTVNQNKVTKLTPIEFSFGSRQCHHDRRVHRRPVAGQLSGGHGAIRHRQRHRDRRQRLHGRQRHGHVRAGRNVANDRRAGDPRPRGRIDRNVHDSTEQCDRRNADAIERRSPRSKTTTVFPPRRQASRSATYRSTKGRAARRRRALPSP